MNIAYTCGPITGLIYDEADGWRRDVGAKLEAQGWTVLSPLAGKAHMADDTPLPDCFEGSDGAFYRDITDIKRSDVVFVNFLGATERVSIGSVGEMGVAYAKSKLIVVCIEPKGNIHDHLFVRRFATFRVDTLDEGVEVMSHLLHPPVGQPAAA